MSSSSSPSRPTLLRGRTTSSDLLDLLPPEDTELTAQQQQTAQQMSEQKMMKGQPILAGSTVFLTANVLKSSNSDLQVKGSLSAPSNDPSCCLRMDNSRFSSECLFQIVFRRDGQARASLEEDMSNQRQNKLHRRRSTVISTTGLTRQNSVNSRTMSMDSSEEIMESIIGAGSWGQERGDVEKKSFEDAKSDFGEPLRFGQYINLVHILSNKVLNKTKNVAPAEPQCLEISLGEVGIESYFRVMPQFKSRSIGDLVYVGDTIYLQCCGGYGEFFFRASAKYKIEDDEDYVRLDPTAATLLKKTGTTHGTPTISESDPAKRSRSNNFNSFSANILTPKVPKDPREVNASSNPTGWVFNMFSPYNPQMDSYVTSCLPFRLRHPETDCYVSHTIVTEKKGATLRLKQHLDNTKCIWMFERFEAGECWSGGILHWGENLRLRHVATGLFLDINEENLVSSGSRRFLAPTLSSQGCALTLEASRGETGPMALADSMFYIRVMTSKVGPLWMFNSGQLHELEEGKYNSSKQTNERKTGVAGRSPGGVRLVFCNFKEAQDALNVEAVESSVLSEALQLNTNIHLCYRLFNLAAKNAIVAQKIALAKGKDLSKRSINSVERSEVDTVRFPPKCLFKVKQVLIECTLATHLLGDYEKDRARNRLMTNPIGYILDGRPVLQNQLNMKTSHMVDIALQIACLPQLIGITLDEIGTSTYSEIRHLVILAYTFIFNCLDHHKVKDYVCHGRVCSIDSVAKLYSSSDNYLRGLMTEDARKWIAEIINVKSNESGTPWIQAMISQLGYELGVGEVLSQLFQDNSYLLERFVNKGEILTFLNLIKTKGPQSRFLNFLKVLARCTQIDGTKRGITQNQELLMNTIFKNGEHDDVIIETALNLSPDGRNKRTYFKLAEFINPSGVWESVDIDKTVMGCNLVTDGAQFRYLMVSWASCNSWFPGSGAEFALFHAAEDLSVTPTKSLEPSPILSLQHKSRTSSDETYDHDESFGISPAKFSDNNQRVLEHLRHAITQIKKEKGSYPNFERQFLLALGVEDRDELDNMTMTFFDFKRVAEAMDIEELFEGSAQLMKDFFQECCMMQPLIKPAPELEFNARMVLMNFIKSVTCPRHSLEWVTLEELLWVLDPSFKAPILIWKTDFQKALRDASKPKHNTDRRQSRRPSLATTNLIENISNRAHQATAGTKFDLFHGAKTPDELKSQDFPELQKLLEPKSFDTLYHKVKCHDASCSGRNCHRAKYQETFDPTRGYSGGSFKNQHRLAQYYNEMLLLVAEQCADRSNNCIRYFQIQYSFEMVFTGLSNPCLPPKVRTSFIKLMTHLYVDRYPHERVLSVDNTLYLEGDIKAVIVDERGARKVQLRKFTEANTLADKERIADHIGSIPKAYGRPAKVSVQEFFEKMSSEKFLLLRDFIANFFIEHRQVNLMKPGNKNFLTLQTAVLDLLYELMDYGFYASVASIKKILRPLAVILDSRQVQIFDEDDFDDSDEEEAAAEPDGRSSFRKKRTGVSSRTGSWDADEDESPEKLGKQATFTSDKLRKQSTRGERSKSFGSLGSLVNDLAKGDMSQYLLAMDQSAPVVMPKYKLTNANWHIQAMRVKVCQIVRLMCSRNVEITIKKLLHTIRDHSKNINRHVNGIRNTRRESATAKTFLDNANLEKFNNRYNKINGGGNINAGMASLGKRTSSFFQVQPKIHPNMEDDDNVDNLMSIFLKACNPPKEETEDLIDLNDITKGAADDIQIDLLMHESPDLFEISILLLNQRHFFKRSLYEAIKAATLVGVEETALNKFLKSHLRQLKNDATSFELWKETFNKVNTEPGKDSKHSNAYMRSIQTLSLMSRISGVYGYSYLRKLMKFESGADEEEMLKKPSTLKLLYDSVDINDVENVCDSHQLINKVLFGLDSEKINVSLYWHAVLASAKEITNALAESPVHRLTPTLPVVLGVFETTEIEGTEAGAAREEDTRSASINNIMVVNNAVKICMRVLSIPFDEISVVSDECKKCQTKIPRAVIAVHMGASELSSKYFTCKCADCGEVQTLEKQHTELFALKRKVMATIEHLSLSSFRTRTQFAEHLPIIEKYILGGLGAEKTFFAIATCSNSSKNVTKAMTLSMLNVISKISSGIHDPEPVTVALRYLIQRAKVNPTGRGELLRTIMENTKVFDKEANFSQNSPSHSLYKCMNKLKYDEVTGYSAKETCEIVQEAQVHTLTLALMGELVAGLSPEVESTMQRTASVHFLVSILTQDTINLLPFMYGTKIAAARCFIGTWLNTSITVPGLLKHPSLSMLLDRLTKDLRAFVDTCELYKNGKSNSDEEANTKDTDPKSPDELFQRHHEKTRHIAERAWVYKGIIPIICSFFSATGPWDTREAAKLGKLNESHELMLDAVKELLQVEETNFDHTDELQKVAKIFEIDFEAAAEPWRPGRKKRRSMYNQAIMPAMSSDGRMDGRENVMQTTFKNYVKYLNNKAGTLQDIFRLDELTLASKLMISFFGGYGAEAAEEDHGYEGDQGQPDAEHQEDEDEVDDEGDSEGENDYAEDIRFDDIAARMIRFIRGKLMSVSQGDSVSEESLQVCKTCIIILQRCCELAASSYTARQVIAIAKKGWSNVFNSELGSTQGANDGGGDDDEVGGQIEEEQVDRLSLIQNALGGMGLLGLCTDIIGIVNDKGLCIQAITLAHWLCKHGHYDNQTRFLGHVKSNENAPKFFERIDKMFEVGMERISPGVDLPQVDEYHQLITVVPLLKELTENHRTELQHCMADQSPCYGNSKAPSYNLLQRATALMLNITSDERLYSKKSSPDLILLLTELFVFLIESSQGPCKENQNVLVSSGIITVVQRILKIKLVIETRTWEYFAGMKEPKKHSSTRSATKILTKAAGLLQKDGKTGFNKTEGIASLIITFKRFKEHAVKMCLSLIEGRTDNYVHGKIITELNPAMLENRLSQVYTRWSLLNSFKQAMQDAPENPMMRNSTFRDYIMQELWLAEGFDILALFKYLERVQPGISRGRIMTGSLPKLSAESFTRLVKTKTAFKTESDLLNIHMNEFTIVVTNIEKIKNKTSQDPSKQILVQLPPNWEYERLKWNKQRFEATTKKINAILSKTSTIIQFDALKDNKDKIAGRRGSSLPEHESPKRKRSVGGGIKSVFKNTFPEKCLEHWNAYRASLSMNFLVDDINFNTASLKVQSMVQDVKATTRGAAKRTTRWSWNKKNGNKLGNIGDEDPHAGDDRSIVERLSKQFDANASGRLDALESAKAGRESREAGKMQLAAEFIGSCLTLTLHLKRYISLFGNSRRIGDVPAIRDKIHRIDKLVEKKGNLNHQSLIAIVTIFTDLIPEGRHFLNIIHPVLEHSRSFLYFAEKLRSIEILNENRQVEKVYFRDPLVCNFLTSSEMEKFRYNLKLETHGGYYADMKHFVSESRDLYYQLLHKSLLSERKYLFGLLNLGSVSKQQEYLRKFQVRCVYLVCLMTLLSMRSKGDWTCCQPFNSNSAYGVGWDDPERSEKFSLASFYERYPNCGTEESPVYDVESCTVGADGEAPDPDLILKYEFAQAWHSHFVTLLLVLIGVANAISAFIHFETKYQVNLDKIKREKYHSEHHQQDNSQDPGGVVPRAFYSSTAGSRGKLRAGTSKKGSPLERMFKFATWGLVIPVFSTLFMVLGDVAREFGVDANDNYLSVGFYLPFVDDIDRHLVRNKQLSAAQVIFVSAALLWFFLEVTRNPRARFLKHSAQRRTKMEALSKTLFNPNFFVPSFTCVVAFIGIKYPIVIPLMGIAVVESSESLKIVFAAIYQPITQLGMVTLLILNVIFLFASLSFFVTRERYAFSGVEGDYLWDSKSCDSLLNCFFTMMTFGLIGWADEFYGGSFMSDVNLVVILNLLMFVLVTVIVLNVITAILLDNFTKLRQEREEHSMRISNYCIICGMSSTECDLFAAKMKNGKTFRHHTTVDHNMENYCLFLFHLMSKSSDEFTGAESYVQACLDADNYGNWCPVMTSYDRQQATLLGLDGDEAGSKGDEGGSSETKEKGKGLDGVKIGVGGMLKEDSVVDIFSKQEGANPFANVSLEETNDDQGHVSSNVAVGMMGAKNAARIFKMKKSN
ncbi:hypothetical protein TrST_g7260 [Triparma strigata]|uniref:Uncharacterized protein n=1 Tax=Triparma strigata TaxID=1606541 RepID=A0A9W7BKW3_9STRA|nr:hypothetical protein TrST_g7260 [Triparma strigata]